ncbi:hypothetical protein [Arthrobacter agilis]|uniref:hypothetical protein n=1 Tax=Arthrobacter agilis TaxID=37921 RepID=UPI00278641DB|nr:hypothetical protein [Arthrobacter agilis]MDQ0735305.1 hypothetical protein [Arthrobacter agilis]
MSAKDNLDLTITATTTEDIQIPISIKVEFPKGYGFYAVKVIQQLGQNPDDLYREMINKQDAATLAVLAQGKS